MGSLLPATGRPIVQFPHFPACWSQNRRWSMIQWNLLSITVDMAVITV